MKEKALGDLEAFHKLRGDEWFYKGSLAWLYAWFGDTEKAQRLEQELLLDAERSLFCAQSIAVY